MPQYDFCRMLFDKRDIFSRQTSERSEIDCLSVMSGLVPHTYALRTGISCSWAQDGEFLSELTRVTGMFCSCVWCVCVCVCVCCACVFVCMCVCVCVLCNSRFIPQTVVMVTIIIF